jgi:hypothetical protein
MNFREFFFGKPKQLGQSSPSINMEFFEAKGFTKTEAKSLIEQAMRLSKRQPGVPMIGELGTFKEKSLKEYCGKGAFNVANALSAIWTQASNDRRNYIQMSQDLRKFYIVRAILDLLVQDVLNPDETGKIVAISSPNKNIQTELDDLCNKIDFDILLEEITRDLIDLGEYAIRLSFKKGKGLVAYYDDYDPMNLIALYEQGVPVNYIQYKDRDFKVLPANEYAHFVIGTNKIRVRLDDAYGPPTSGGVERNSMTDAQRENLPDYIRVGEPLFYGIMPKLRELQLLEQLIPATKLNQITQAQMVSMKVPAGMAPEKVMEALKRYEALLNIPTGIDTTSDQITLAEIMTVTGKVRVIPNFADEKGTLDPLNVRNNPPVDDILNSIKDIREVILSSIGIPMTQIFGSTTIDKAAELRLFSRYTRRLASIQKALKRGLMQILLGHLVNKGISCTEDDIEIVFTHSLVDISGLEKLEFDDAKQAIVGNTLDFVAKITSDTFISSAIDHAELIKWLNEKFSVLADGYQFFKTEGKELKAIADQAAMLNTIQHQQMMAPPEGEPNSNNPMFPKSDGKEDK